MDSPYITELCEGMDEDACNRIKAAYWQGCIDGIKAALDGDIKEKISHIEGNIVYLHNRKKE